MVMCKVRVQKRIEKTRTNVTYSVAESCDLFRTALCTQLCTVCLDKERIK